ncbi:unnamed protein product [Cylicocyclus nassatus]|uniref:Uncharacterized protein n=1 Tax=Cylicocyclus nassatus TaxID=53992 RepID=A0AA36H8E6_CYLNA|nr:unnamed protein product [Cylicocyclus nassatus]
MKVAIAVLLLTYCQVRGDVMRRNERLESADNANGRSTGVSRNASADVERESEVVVDSRKGLVETVSEREKRSDEKMHLQRHTGMHDLKRDVRSNKFEAFDGDDEEDVDEGIQDRKRKRLFEFDDYDEDDEDDKEYYENEALNGRIHNLFVVFDFSKKDAEAKAALISMLQKLVEGGDRIEEINVDDDASSDAFAQSPDMVGIGKPFNYEDNEDYAEEEEVRARGRKTQSSKTRQSRRRMSKKKEGKQITQSLCRKKNKRIIAKREISGLCHKKHKRMIAKLEISGCKGAVEFSEMICADYNACISKNGNNCEALICPKFKSVSKRESCYNQLFDCDN